MTAINFHSYFTTNLISILIFICPYSVCCNRQSRERAALRGLVRERAAALAVRERRQKERRQWTDLL